MKPFPSKGKFRPGFPIDFVLVKLNVKPHNSYSSYFVVNAFSANAFSE
jgi:hypothetical protein